MTMPRTQGYTSLARVPDNVAREDLDVHIQAATMRWAEEITEAGWRPAGRPDVRVDHSQFDGCTWIRVTGLTDKPADAD